MDKREQILTALAAFIAQKPGLEFGNYGEVSAYRSEMRAITRDRHDAERLLAQVAWRTESIGERELRAAFRAFSGRLSLVDRPDGAVALDYCTGQYFPTEYRKAVCAVLSQALWTAKRDSADVDPSHDGEWMRREFRKEFGARMADRWFN